MAGGGPRPLGTLLFPLLVVAVWLLAQFLAQLAGFAPEQRPLVGALPALLLLFILLPRRVRRVWGDGQPWRRLGLARPLGEGVLQLLRGLGQVLVLLTGLVLVLLIGGWAQWQGALPISVAVNGVLLLGVGLAEELLFRGWLLGELEQQLPARRALLLQGLLFGLVHPWYRLAAPWSWAQLLGLSLLGVVLGLQRRSDGGSLAGAVGLHGGLVGGWFVIQEAVLGIQPDTPAWLLGPGGAAANPVGGLLGLMTLLILIRLNTGRVLNKDTLENS